LRRNLGGRPTDVLETFGSLRTLHECDESELKCEEQRDKVGTKRNVQQAPVRFTAIMSPGKQ
jgi:hypothetical protein